MINEHCFRSDWIREVARETKYDPTLIEKVIHAFKLLGTLQKNKLNFVFKGGTSLILILKERFQRLSIDIDIVLLNQVANEDLSKIFNRIIKDSHFNKWEERKSRDKLRYYKFYYKSDINNREEPILLDVMSVDTNPYAKLVETEITSIFFETVETIKVKVPTVNSIFADKLTAFAPDTIGIPLQSGKSTEIIKQLFDLGSLFQFLDDLEEMGETYKRISILEAEMRKIPHEITRFLKDSFDTAYLICQLDFRGSIRNEKTEELKNGIKSFKSFVGGGRYNLQKAKEDASKVAFISYILKSGFQLDLNGVIKSIYKTNINRLEALTKYNLLNKLKNISPLGFSLWNWIENH